MYCSKSGDSMKVLVEVQVRTKQQEKDYSTSRGSLVRRAWRRFLDMTVVADEPQNFVETEK